MLRGEHMRRPWLIPAVIALIVAGSAAPARADDTIIGKLVDVACYHALGGENAPEGALQKCSLDGAQKGQRLALINKKGNVYLVTGPLTENNNKKLLPLIGLQISLTGVLGQINTLPPVEPEPDTRRTPRRDNAIIAKQSRKADHREGDPRMGTATTISATSAFDVVTRVIVQ